MSKTLRKIAMYTIAKINGRYARIYWSWYERESERTLLHQLTKILEEDDENNRRSDLNN